MVDKQALRARLHSLYYGETPQARRFRYGLVLFDLFTISIFLLEASVADLWWLAPLDIVVALVLTLELAARIFAEKNRRACLFSLATASDIIVIVSLFLAAFVDNLGFLRIVRALRLLRSYHLLRDLRSDLRWFRRSEDVVQRTVNLLVFIFIVTSLVFVTQHNINPQIKTYVDALYFTITTLTTTGFGDITLIGTGGRLLAVIIMIVGVALFLRLLQAVFRPNKVRFPCPECALQLHDIDSVHCKHCGHRLAIPDEGVV